MQDNTKSQATAKSRPIRRRSTTKLLVILGPTATGKSDLAVFLARKLKGEVISADSRQVYRGLNIGTGKITGKEMKGVRHHLLDVADPKRDFNVSGYVRLADKAIKNISSRGKLPIICGGTGFYIQALVDGLRIPNVPPDLKLRRELSKKTTVELCGLLKQLDSARFKTIDKNNPRRLIRAIEIAKALGRVPSLKNTIDTLEGAAFESGRGANGLNMETDESDVAARTYDPIFIGLNLPAAELKERIGRRLIKRLKNGMLEEAERLHRGGLSWKRMETLGLEYRYEALHLQGKLSKEEMVERLNTAIWHYAKRQMTWFKRDGRIRWFKPEQGTSIFKYLTKQLQV